MPRILVIGGGYAGFRRPCGHRRRGDPDVRRTWNLASPTPGAFTVQNAVRQGKQLAKNLVRALRQSEHDQFDPLGLTWDCPGVDRRRRQLLPAAFACAASAVARSG